MTREEAIEILEKEKVYMLSHGGDRQATALTMAIKALEQEPMEKFESVKDHIFKLAGDYKCWDNRLTHDEALELCHILEQEPKLKIVKMRNATSEERDSVDKYIKSISSTTGVDFCDLESCEYIQKEKSLSYLDGCMSGLKALDFMQE